MSDCLSNRSIVRLRCSMLSLLAAIFLGLPGCGESEVPEPEAAPTIAERSQAAASAATAPAADPAAPASQAPDRAVNSLIFEASGDAEGRVESDGTDLMLTGGCLDRNVIGMSFTRGQLTDEDLFQIRLRTADAVGPGETGAFPVSELGWYNGQFKPEGLPTEAKILVPNAYEGTGTLTLTRHDEGGSNGRMAGTVEGSVKQLSGENEATIVASFDINLGCIERSLDGLN